MAGRRFWHQWAQEKNHKTARDITARLSTRTAQRPEKEKMSRPVSIPDRDDVPPVAATRPLGMRLTEFRGGS
jgi:hypothetical protein